MGCTEKDYKELKKICNTFRKDVIQVLHERQTGHPGGSLSVCEIITTLLMKKMNVNPKKPSDPNRDRLILSKGHAAPMLYRALAEKGFFKPEELHTLRKINTRLQGHPQMLETPGVDLTSGPLGVGLSASVGIALGLKLNKSKARVYTVLGDGEINEGTVWEAAMSAVKFKTDNLVAILDWNGVQLDGTNDEIMPLGNVKAKFESFGWNTIELDGHDIKALLNAYDKAETVKDKPTVILARTVKGKGVSFMEGKNAWHGKPIDDKSYELAMEELRRND